MTNPRPSPLINWAACLALLVLAAPVLQTGPSYAQVAQQGPVLSLKANPRSDKSQITFGDVFDNAGASANAPIARSPGPDQMVVFGAEPLQARARAAGLNWPNREGVRQIVVNGPGRTDPLIPFQPTASTPSVPDIRQRASAAAAPTRPEALAVLGRTIQRGEAIQAEDVVWIDTPSTAPRDALADPEALIGKTAKRVLLANTPLRAMDVMDTPSVRRNEPVTLIYEADGLRLSVRGKALGDAAIGANVKVLNPKSNKVLEAIVDGPGTARVMLSQLSARVPNQNGVN
jgi:flagellar basal body P-ring formation protein FlgA